MSAFALFAANMSAVNSGSLPGSGSNNATSNELQTLLGVFFGIIGGIAVLMVVISGFMYVTSAGDPGKAAKARNSIIYALIGLAVAIAAEGIVAFVVGKL